MDEGNGEHRKGGEQPAVFQATEYSPLRTTVALALWLGGIHFNVALVLATLLLLPLRLAAASVSSSSSSSPFLSSSCY
ncbi:hypothetical protein B296_00010994 [Ensete ventricosum]|uniref:Uncharacterized protein n=1 Tax=Ensete ventricosum TaxID=4639 RepID=A0A427B8A7_ENSVE|nr:hypothetical protein B296_00010994 [Ensete ventricosum]